MIQILDLNYYRGLGPNYPSQNRKRYLKSSRECFLGCRQYYLMSLQVYCASGVKIGFPTIHLLRMDESFKLENVCQSLWRSYTPCCKMGKTISLKYHDPGKALETCVPAKAEEAFPAGSAEC